ncbi:glycerophosphodiester phosphodiesterase [Pediococcus cellicola]|uniref:Glycerophosphoryl diester phosphodiesterase n=1 Tax=Pediococcus cellicola TaxID=319652 RepID=A0A0R2J0M8_9LACO|nr:glycerophosphodiester phosphodiesterase [Pediococcus cellicola]KRN67716.1 glycerophosphoryl diester phosphodiesterase [Pediococcus cellicola]GEL14293.1 glycerophosphoryl diester phosphodiesterase [Pediococcus cellicola]
MLTKIIAHRGSKGIRPENTLPAFEKAIEEGADGIETDVHMSKDGHLIIMHDETVDRTTNGQGRIMDQTLMQLKTLDAGSYFGYAYLGTQIPTLNEVIQLLIAKKFKGIFNLELKTDKIQYPGIEEKVLAYMNQQELPFKVIYSSFHPQSLVKMYSLNPDIEYASLFKVQTKFARRLYRKRLIRDWHPDIRWVRAHRFFLPHVQLRPWTVNSDDDMRYCFKRRFDGIITDYPGRAVIIRKSIQGG